VQGQKSLNARIATAVDLRQDIVVTGCPERTGPVRDRLFFLFCLLLSACAPLQPAAPRTEFLFHDELFAAPSERVGAEDIFALSEPMKRYVQTEIASKLRTMGPQLGLVEALYKQGKLKLEYDAAVTRNAAEAFESQSGNCLSLVIMTAAFAKELGLWVWYQSAYLEETWSRSGNLLLRSGHVNLTLERKVGDSRRHQFRKALTIDFLPSEEIRGLRTIDISEETVIAMFMNNRAVEALVQGRIDDAYAWARESIRRNPEFMSSLNTLGIIYMRKAALQPAEQVFSYVLEREPLNTRAMANLTETFARQGKVAESSALRQRLAQLEPDPPFHYFNLGLAAMKRDDYRLARDLFAKEVARADYYAEFHYWLGLASFKLGDIEQAGKHLALAREYSSTRGDRDLYSAKLAWLKAQAQQ
jgi:tetratricopeptide (TPR) repeat protein